MACVSRIRERLNVKLDGWSAYVEAIGGPLDVRSIDTLGRLGAAKLRLLGSLEHLGRELADAETVAIAARMQVDRVTRSLRTQLGSGPSTDTLAYAQQKEALVAAMHAAEDEFNAVASALGHPGSSRLEGVIERTVRAMLRLEAELDVAEIWLRAKFDDRAGLDIGTAQELIEAIGSVRATIAIARTLTADGVGYVEPEIVSGLRRLRELLAARVA